MGAGLVIDLLANDRALQIVDAEVQRQLRQRRRHHDPVRLEVLEIVEKETAHGEILQIVESRRRRARASELDPQLVVVGMVRKRDVGQEATRLILKVAQHPEVVDAILVGLDMAIQHRAVGPNTKLVGRAVHLDVFGARQLAIGDRGSDARAEYFGASAGHRVEPCVPQRDENVPHAHLVDARDMRDLHRRERLDVHLRVTRLEPAKHLVVVGESRLHVEPTNDVELAGHATGRALGFRIHLLHRVAVRAVLLWQARIGAEDARLPKDADVRGIDVLIGRKGDAIAMPGAVRSVSHCAKSKQIGSAKERNAVVHGEALACDHLVGDGKQRRVGNACAIERDGEGHCATLRTA